MSESRIHPDLEGLLAKLMSEGLDAAEQSQLNQILVDDRSSRLFYRKYLMVDALLRWENAPPIDGGHVVEDSKELGVSDWGLEEATSRKQTVADDGRPLAKIENPTHCSPPAPYIVVDAPSPFAPFAFYNSHPFLFSNLFALFVMSIGALGAWLYQVDVPSSTARANRRSAATYAAINAERSENRVGRITGIADCRLQEGSRLKARSSKTRDFQSLIPNPQSLVSLGDRFVLSSGLLEITYDTGAKVILQGPVTYEIDSAAGGFLSSGKLTARLEKKRAKVRDQASENVASGQPSVVSGQWSVASATNPKSQIRKSQISNPQSPVSEFAVRTPTATVTDLGTEFGVEVQPNCRESVVVFQGKVQVAVRNERSNVARQVQTLLAGQETSIDGNAQSFAVGPQLANATNAKRFVRTMPASVKPISAKSPEVMAGNHLVLWLKADALPNREDGAPVGNWPDSSGNTNNMYHIAMELPTYVSGAKSGLNHRPVVRFSGREQLRGFLDIDPRTPGIQPLKPPFTLLSVVKNADVNNEQSIVRGYFGGGDERLAFGMNYKHVAPTSSFWAWTPNQFCTFGQANSINTNWNIHAYTVPDILPSHWTWRCNGVITGGVGLDSGKVAPYEEPVCIGTSGSNGEFWIGDIAELMLYDRVLTDQELAQAESYLARKYGIPNAWSVSETSKKIEKPNTTTQQEILPMKPN